MHRFFVDPQTLTGARVVLQGPVRHQIKDVLRLAPGERIVLLDGAGYEYTVVLSEVGRDVVAGEIAAKTLSVSEPRINIRLYQGVLKGAKFELVLQKGTELGVAAFIPVIFRRSVTAGDFSPAKFERWGRIIVEAAEQSGRARLPELSSAVPFGEAVKQAYGLRIIPWEEEAETGLREALSGWQGWGSGERAISVFVGPEGGITREEIDMARGSGVIPVSLGARILRAETAPLAVVAAVMYHFNELEPAGSSFPKP